MKQVLKYLSFLIIAVLVCTSSSHADAARAAAGFRYAYAHGDCAPWDGPALSIIVQTQPVAAMDGENPPRRSYPYYGVTLWTGTPPVGTYIEIPGADMRQGSMGECLGENQCKRLTGRVRLTKKTADRVEGELRVASPGEKGGELVIPFSAPILPVRMICG